MLKFIHIPKTAGMSICKAMGIHAGHKPVVNVKKDDYIFSCVRNPYDRSVSLFYYLKQNCPVFCDQFLNNGEEINDFWLKPSNLKRLKFAQAQKQWLNESTRVDLIIKFEELTTDWKHLQEMSSLPDLEHINQSARQPWQDELSPEAIAIIGELYADDFEHLGYERIS